MKKIILSLLFSFLIVMAFGQISSSGLVLHYSLDGTAEDKGDNKLNGTVYGAIPTVDRFGNPKGAYHFDGIDDYIMVGDSSILNPSSSTVCCWFNTEFSNKTMQLIRWRLYGYSLSIDNYNNPADSGLSISCYVGKNNYYDLQDAKKKYTDGKWHFVVMSYDGLNAKMYVDNQLVSSKNNFGPSAIYYGKPGKLAIGRDGDNSALYFKGKLDDIRIYNRALSQSEIASLYFENICQQSITVTDTLVINLKLSTFNPVTYESTIKVYQNTTNDLLYIDCGETYNSMANKKVVISSVDGKAVFESTIDKQITSLDLTVFKVKGVYVLNVVDQDGNILAGKKIVIN
jgi:hypothetical protein